MKFAIFMSVFLSTSVFADFKLTVNSKEKPVVKIAGEEKTKKVPSSTVQLQKEQSATSVKPILKPRMIENPDAVVQTRKTDMTEVKNNPVDIEKKYQEIIARKEAKMLAQKPPVKSNPLIAPSTKLKASLSAKKGETVQAVLEKWAKKNRYGIIFELGEWERVLKLPLAADIYYSSDFIGSVKEFLENLNELDQFKENKIILHSCFFTNPFVEIVLNDCGDKS